MIKEWWKRHHCKCQRFFYSWPTIMERFLRILLTEVFGSTLHSTTKLIRPQGTWDSISSPISLINISRNHSSTKWSNLLSRDFQESRDRSGTLSEKYLRLKCPRSLNHYASIWSITYLQESNDNFKNFTQNKSSKQLTWSTHCIFYGESLNKKTTSMASRHSKLECLILSSFTTSWLSSTWKMKLSRSWLNIWS